MDETPSEVIADADDVVLYDIPLTASIEELLADPETQWYGEKMLLKQAALDGQDTAITASADFKLTSPEDVPTAIAAAIDNPDLRWWVERRIESLGLDVEVPWS